MAEKDYKRLYENSLKKNRKMKKKIEDLEDTVFCLQEEQFSCDVEPLKGELFGRTIAIVEIKRKKYVYAEMWTTENGYNGHLVGTDKPKSYNVFLRSDEIFHPIPDWCRDVDLDFVVTRENFGKFILNPPEGQPVHLLIHGNVWAWEGWDEDVCSPMQVVHDNAYLSLCADDAARFGPIENE